jgi:hypothetical protein
MSYSEIALAPGSGRPISLVLSQGNGEPIDFTVGSWSARLVIVPYPKYVGVPFVTLSTVGVEVTDGDHFEWLTLNADSKLTLTPDPLVTPEWQFSRYHYDCFTQGPNLSSKPNRVGHGPFKMDW